ncbi:MAG: periplasmic heavy metal sensor [Deltaproteobacteria bacterium]|nr:MAG: periplasmic heavy metal sensor [Deltaproteobacteria bacterium]TMQ09852.1 MAG: periplasmic heavy metal sensor [Deltaproteobacteria bacterium]
MTCLAIAIAVLGIAAMRRAHRRCHGYYGHGWYGPFGHGHWGHHGWHGKRHARARMMLHALFMRIDASPAQERAIIAEFEKLQDRMRAAKAGLSDARGDLGAALRGPALDDAALGAVLGRVDTATGEVRAAVVDALRGVHGVLDDRQRGQIADLLDRGGWWRGFGPYR